MEAKLSFDIEADELEIFLEDVNEIFQEMESGILRLEGAADVETLNSVFRAAHTLKAVAGTVGHHAMAELTHTVETLFDRLRMTEESPSQAVIDELLTTVDILKTLRDEVVTLEPSGVDVEAALARLKTLTEEKEGAQAAQEGEDGRQRGLTEEQADRARSYREGEREVLEVQAAVAADAFAPAARLMQAMMALAEVGEVIAQEPTQDDLMSGQQDGWLWVVLASEGGKEAIEAQLSEITDLGEYRVRAYEMDGGTGESDAEEIQVPAKEQEQVPQAPVQEQGQTPPEPFAPFPLTIPELSSLCHTTVTPPFYNNIE